MGPNVGADFSGRPLGRLLQRSNITEGAGRDVEAVEGVLRQQTLLPLMRSTRVANYFSMSSIGVFQWVLRMEPGQVQQREGDLAKMSRKILDALPEAVRDALDDALDLATDPNTRERLERIFVGCDLATAIAITAPTEPHPLRRRIVG